MTSELKPCPFCLRPLKRSSGKFNPMAVCETDGCWMKEKQIAVPCDDPFSVKSWNTRAVPDVPEIDVNRSTTKDVECQNNQSMTHNANVPELVRYRPAVYMEPCLGGMFNDEFGEYVLHSEVAKIVAEKDARIKEMETDVSAYILSAEDQDKRRKALEAELAQIKAQEPVGHIVVDKNGYVELSTFNTSLGFERGVHNLYFHPAPASDSLKADAARYQYLRSRDLETVREGGIFAGVTPENYVINGIDLDNAIDAFLNVEASNDKG